MKAAVLHKARDLRIEEVPQPVPAADEVLVRIKAVGVCGSDLHFYHEGRVGTKVVTQPLILGHEAAGEVVEVGAAVTTFKPGDRVTLEPGIPCRKCAACKRGEYQLCPESRFQSSPNTDGFFAEYAALPADYVYRLPDNLDYIEGAMIEPFQVGLQAAWQGEIEPGQTVAIFGAGPIGLYSLQAALLHGAAQVIIGDVLEKRLKMAKEMGATRVVNVAETSLVDEVLALTGGVGADVVLEASGAVPAVQQSLFAARRGGTIVQVAWAVEQMVPIDYERVVRGKLQIRGCFRYANQYPKAVALAAAGRVDLRTPVTHTFPLEQTKEALDMSLHNKAEAVKVVVTI
jgi:L-iditol 2-dehydrogenase